MRKIYWCWRIGFEYIGFDGKIEENWVCGCATPTAKRTATVDELIREVEAEYGETPIVKKHKVTER